MALPTSYAFWNISFEVFCIISTVMLLYKQLTVFNRDNAERALTVVLFLQLFYIASFIPRVLVDMEVIAKTQFTVYAVTIVNVVLFMYCCYRVFIFLELYQNTPGFKLWKNRIVYALPALFNVVVLLTSPITGIYLSVAPDASVASGSLWYLMIVINCFYPSAALVSFVVRNRGKLKEAGDFAVTVAFPLAYAVFGPLSALQWRIPILPFGLMLAELFVYVHYTDLMMQERNRRLELEKTVAEKQNKAKSDFLSNMSHDIRTPMNAIIGFTDLAIQNPEDVESVKEYLGKIKASSNHLLSLINDVLEMSRIESGKIELDETECSLPEILHDLNTIIIGQVEAKRHELFMDAVNVTDENIYCDKLRLNQVLLNLLSNAVKYTPVGGKVSVRVIQKDGAPEGYGAYEIHVKDNGIGMTPEFAAKVFEAFEREKTSTVSGIQGTGLGMAITKRIVDMMGGTIAVETAPGEGTEFIVQVNFRLQDEQRPPLRIAELEGKRALVVDDDFDTCDSTTNILRGLGVEADWTLSGKEAVVRAKQAHKNGNDYELFLVDLRLEDISGLEVSEQLRDIVGQEPTIMLVTAYDWPSIKDEAVQAGISGFMSKPLFKSELYAALIREIKGASVSEEQVQEAEKATASFAGKRLLLVDDIEINREIAVTILEMSDFAVEEACDGVEAVEKVENSEPGYYDAVLMDIQMPTMNGHDASRAIRALPDPALSSIPIIAMTANAFDEDKQAALDAGMNDHVAKPIDVDKLMVALSKVID